MCGRYARRSDKQKLSTYFHANPAPGLLDLPPDYNVAPTTMQPVVRHTRDGGTRELLLMRWGLVPSFAKSLADFKGYSTFNAKAESIAKTNTWREPFTRAPATAVPGRRDGDAAGEQGRGQREEQSRGITEQRVTCFEARASQNEPIRRTTPMTCVKMKSASGRVIIEAFG